MPIVIDQLDLSFGLSFEDLYRREGLAHLDDIFIEHLQAADAALSQRLIDARLRCEELSRKQQSELILEIAPHLEDFIGELFGISEEIRELQSRHDALAPFYAVKRKFVQKKAISGVTREQASALNGPALEAELEALFNEPLTEASFVAHVSRWLDAEPQHKTQLQTAAQYAAWAALSPAGMEKHRQDVLFKVPHKLDMNHLIQLEMGEVDGIRSFEAPPNELRHREGFKLTDAGMGLKAALDQAHYCIKCHHQGKDSCSTGLKEKDGAFKKSVFGITLAGCPLEEKVSEMNVMKEEGRCIGALAIAVIDNAMVAGTGHRICNDCMKSCIFQKQEPVDIPQVETRSLKDVLELPWGFEIYSLVTRWNPLNFMRPLPKPKSGYKVLVVGLGPAGFTLAYHLMNDGHTVVGVDGLKIEPLPEEISGVGALGERVRFHPVRDVNELYESLDDRVMAGFGGVAEYGITVRWNKNFLKIIRLLLERRREFSMFGGVRFGGTLTVEGAFELGFDHVALCAGAGRPTVIPMKNGLARGVRQASDFLMALQLTGAAKTNSVANLQLRMPIVVIGGGLTAIDTATESMAYYVVQVDKFLERYETLVAEKGEREVRAGWTAEESETAAEFLSHAYAIRAERALAAREGRNPKLAALLNTWGGVTIAYRRRLIDAPSYTLNHEEVALALEEGIRFAESLTPQEVELDQFGHAAALRVKTASGSPVRMPAKSILVAAGTQPNTVLGREDQHNVFLDGKWFQAVGEDGNPVKPERVAKPAQVSVLMSIRKDGRGISFFGDLHPSFAGNVVKAMASAKQGYPVVSRLLVRKPPSPPRPADLLKKLNYELRVVVKDVVRLTPNIVEVIAQAPTAARAFQPGQFYRLQNYESLAPRVDGTVLGMEGLALTGASVDREKGLLSTIVLEMGGSSDLCALLKPGEPMILMGPTGTPTETPSHETALLIGGGLGNAVLFSIGQQLRAQGSRTIYFAGYKKIIDRYKVEEIEKAADIVVWCCDEAPGFTPNRVQDKAFVGNIVDAILAYGRGDFAPAADALPAEEAESDISLHSVDRLVVIGSDAMMGAVARARHTVLAPYLKPDHKAIGSINSPMQCMMKEICAQCLQQHKDPVTGEETVVFSCFNQDQSLDHVDFANLRTRLSQNGVQEKLTKLWIDRCLRLLGAREELALS